MLSVPSEWQAYEVNGWFPSNPSKKCKRCPSRDQTFISCAPTQYQKLRQIKSRNLTLSCSRQPFQPDELPAFLVVAPAPLRRSGRSAARPGSREAVCPFLSAAGLCLRQIHAGISGRRRRGRRSRAFLRVQACRPVRPASSSAPEAPSAPGQAHGGRLMRKISR